MAKKEIAVVKIQVKSKQATPSSGIGPALGQHGVNIMSFCKEFNERTSNQEEGTIVPVIITIYNDKSFSFIIKTPPVSVLLKKIAGIDKGSGVPNKENVAKITRLQIKEVAEKKLNDLNVTDVKKAMKIVEGTAKSMGITVEE